MTETAPELNMTTAFSNETDPFCLNFSDMRATGSSPGWSMEPANTIARRNLREVNFYILQKKKKKKWMDYTKIIMRKLLPCRSPCGQHRLSLLVSKLQLHGDKRCLCANPMSPSEPAPYPHRRSASDQHPPFSSHAHLIFSPSPLPRPTPFLIL